MKFPFYKILDFFSHWKISFHVQWIILQEDNLLWKGKKFILMRNISLYNFIHYHKELSSMRISFFLNSGKTTPCDYFEILSSFRFKILLNFLIKVLLIFFLRKFYQVTSPHIFFIPVTFTSPNQPLYEKKEAKFTHPSNTNLISRNLSIFFV